MALGNWQARKLNGMLLIYSVWAISQELETPSDDSSEKQWNKISSMLNVSISALNLSFDILFFFFFLHKLNPPLLFFASH